MVVAGLAVHCDSAPQTPVAIQPLDGIPMAGLLAFFPFDGSLDDASTNGHHGINHGASFSRNRFGKDSSAVSFDGIDDYVDLKNSNTLQIQLPISISYWVRLSQVESTSAAFTTNFSTEANTGIFLAFDSRGGNPSISLGDGGPPGSASRRTKHAENGFEADRWSHVVGVVEDWDEMTVYVDGSDGGGAYDGSARDLHYTGGPASLGRRVSTRNGPSIFFGGVIDELAIYGRALTLADVDQLFEGRLSER